jgi:Zn-dependent protease with chaperone function
MHSRPSSFWHHIRKHALLSLGLWLVVLAAGAAYLAWAARGETGSGDRFGTGGDSIALPLLALAIWLAIALLVPNLAAAIVLAYRRRRESP